MKKLRLVKLTDQNKYIMDLMFLPSNDGFFRENYKAPRKKQEEYVDSLLKMSSNILQAAIEFNGEIVGFILVAGRDNRVVGGLVPGAMRKGIYSIARNTVINLLNQHGVYMLTNGVDSHNKRMLSFMEKVPHSRLREFGDLYLSHVNHELPLIEHESIVSKRLRIRNNSDMFYYLSFIEENGPKQLSLERESKINTIRPLMTIDPELSFRAIYNDVKDLIDNRGNLTFKVHSVRLDFKRDKGSLGPDSILQEGIDDSHITLEHYTSKPVDIKYERDITFSVDRKGGMLMYRPNKTGELKPHSPLKINVI